MKYNKREVVKRLRSLAEKASRAGEKDLAWDLLVEADLTYYKEQSPSLGAEFLYQTIERYPEL